MEFEELVRTRRSVRGFKDDPVPRQLIDEIIAVAKGAPSSMNSQPWHVHVLAGAPLDEVRPQYGRNGSGGETEAGHRDTWAL
jgi:nitroreductase